MGPHAVRPRRAPQVSPARQTHHHLLEFPRSPREAAQGLAHRAARPAVAAAAHRRSGNERARGCAVGRRVGAARRLALRLRPWRRERGARAPGSPPVSRGVGGHVREAGDLAHGDRPVWRAHALDDGALAVPQVRLPVRAHAPPASRRHLRQAPQAREAADLAARAGLLARVLLHVRTWHAQLRADGGQSDLPADPVGRRPRAPRRVEGGAHRLPLDRRRDDSAEARGLDSPPRQARGRMLPDARRPVAVVGGGCGRL
mmetsp:Transcript_1199/g.2761  ORF Transcript_1199/g.2761 Transcript_1199/m.2761 type:complete len:258 (-) Transcript_1199:694-1467(-)